MPVAPCRQRLPGALGPACPLRAISGATSRQPSHGQRRVSFRASRAAGRLCFLRVSGSGGPWGHAPRGGGAVALAHSSVSAPAQAPPAWAWWPGRREQVDQTCADTEPPQRLQVRLASARSRVLPPTLASPGGRCDEDRGMAIVGTAGTRVCPTLARRQALCLSRPRMPSCLMPPDRFAEGICRPRLQMRKRRLGAAKHVAQNHLGAAFGLEVRGC